MTASAMTSSATLRVFEYGALNTGTPSDFGGVDVDLVRCRCRSSRPPIRRRACAEYVGGQVRARTNADQVARRRCGASSASGSAFSWYSIFE